MTTATDELSDFERGYRAGASNERDRLQQLLSLPVVANNPTLAIALSLSPSMTSERLVKALADAMEHGDKPANDVWPRFADALGMEI